MLLDLGLEFYNIWGYRSSAFDPQPAAVNGNVMGKRLETGSFGTPYYAMAAGREYYMPVTARWVDYGPATGRPAGAETRKGVAKVLELPHPVVSWEGDMTTVMTGLTERGSKVLELVNQDSYTIEIKGLMINSANEYPEEMVKTLHDMWISGAALELSCVALDVILKNNGLKVFVKKPRILENKGVKHVRGYELSCVTVSDFNLEQIN